MSDHERLCELFQATAAAIGQAVAIGDRRPYNVALIVLDADGSAAYAAAAGRSSAAPVIDALYAG